MKESNEVNEYIQVEGRLVRTVYWSPDENVYGKRYQIFIFEVDDVLSGQPEYVFDQRNPKSSRNIMCIGNAPSKIYENCTYSLTGTKVIDPKYGVQYKIISMNQKVNFSDYYDQKKFLSLILTEAQVKSLYDTLSNPVEYFEKHDIDTLSKVKGIKTKTALKLLKRYDETKESSVLSLKLTEYGFTESMINKIIGNYGTDISILDKLKENPYILIKTLGGIGFKTADALAAKLGFSRSDYRRFKAYVEFFLNTEAEDNGNSYVSAIYLRDNVHNFFEDCEDSEISNGLSQAIKELQSEGIIKIEDNENKNLRRVYLTSVYKLEQDIANELKRIMSVEGPAYDDKAELLIHLQEDRQGFKFAKEQIDGIKLGLTNQVCLISGLAGTGKSSLVSGILAACPEHTFAQCALSGKAAARLQEVTHSQGKTIHRLLEYDIKSNGFMRNSENPLDEDIIILDEVSLVGGELFLDLLKAIDTGAKLIMLGDLGQLEAIGKLNIAYDIYHSDSIPTVELKEIHRQAAQSGIISVSHDVRNQTQVFSSTFYGDHIYGELKDMCMSVLPYRDNIISSALNWYMRWYNSPLVNKDPNKIQAISPVKERGSACVHELNKQIQAIINPLTDGEKVIYLEQNNKEDFLHINDKVMCIKNYYNAINEDSKQVSIFNGWVGTITQVDDDFVTIFFPLLDDTVVMDFNKARAYLVLGYASTVHKLQGSDVPVVIGVLDYSTPPSMLSNALLYTLITRAKKKCVVVCENSAVRKAISTNNVSKKHTFLQELLDK